MDAEGFDRLAKGLGRGTDRRRLLAGLLGGAVPALLGSRGTGAGGTCKPGGKRCRKKAQCCSRRCVGRRRGRRGFCGPCGSLRENCDAQPCCPADQTTCGPNSGGSDLVCCRPLGGECTCGGPLGDCCMVPVPSGADFAYCAPGRTCGGSGAACRFNEACVSGACNDIQPGGFGTCA